MAVAVVVVSCPTSSRHAWLCLLTHIKSECVLAVSVPLAAISYGHLHFLLTRRVTLFQFCDFHFLPLPDGFPHVTCVYILSFLLFRGFRFLHFVGELLWTQLALIRTVCVCVCGN